MKKELLFSETKESKKEYLSRMAILLDIIRNFPDLKASHPLLMAMDGTDVKEFENYLCLITYKAKIVFKFFYIGTIRCLWQWMVPM